MNLSRDKRLFRNDLLLFLSLVLICALILFFRKGNDDAATALITYSDGRCESISLSEDKLIDVDSEYGHNQIVVKNHSICISEADCKDELCVKQGCISKSGESIVCLPHKLSILIVDGAESNIDSMTY